MKEPIIILSEKCPSSPCEAFVEVDEATVYFYLSDPTWGVRSCWVRNISSAPEFASLDRMRQGLPPLLSREQSRFPNGLPAPNGDSLDIVWYPEGYGAVLRENREPIAIIPPWNECIGFARDCLLPNKYAIPLERGNVLLQRCLAAEEFWNSWTDVPWPTLQAGFIDAYEKAFGPHSKYYAIDGDNWPPKALLRFDLDSCKVIVTAGVSILPQPSVESFIEDPRMARRIELGFCLSPHGTDAILMDMASYISGQSSLPWFKATWLGEGHSIPCDSLPNPFSYVLCCSRSSQFFDLRLPMMYDDPVNLLWLVPITKREQESCVKHGSKQFIERYFEAGFSEIFRSRQEIK